MAESAFIARKNQSRFAQDNHLMADALPKRKMFSSNPVSDKQYHDDLNGGGTQEITALAKYAKTGNGLRKVLNPNAQG